MYVYIYIGSLSASVKSLSIYNSIIHLYLSIRLLVYQSIWSNQIWSTVFTLYPIATKQTSHSTIYILHSLATSVASSGSRVRCMEKKKQLSKKHVELW